MTTRHVLIQMAVYGAALGTMDAFLGRVLQASTDVSFLLLLLASSWIGFAIGAVLPSRVAVVAALMFFATFMTAYAAVAHILVGWNNSAPWRVSLGRLAWFSLASTIVALLSARAAVRARAAKRGDRHGAEA